MIARIVLLTALLAHPVQAAKISDLSPAQQEAIGHAAVGLAFAHGCATFLNTPFLVQDALRLLESAFLEARVDDPVGQTHEAYWKIVTQIREGEFGPDGIFDAAACRIVEDRIGEAAKARRDK